MEFLLRYFIDGNVYCKGHKWTYTHAAQMIIPRIGEHVLLVDDDICVEVDMVTYTPNCYDDDNLYLVDIECHDITDVLDECDEDDDEEEDY